MRQHDEQALLAVEGDLGILIEGEVGEERHDKGCRRSCVDRGRIEHRHGERPRSVMGVGKFDLLDPN